MDKRSMRNFSLVFAVWMIVLLVFQKTSLQVRVTVIVISGILGYILALSGIRRAQKYYRLATFDELTGLVNFRLSMARLREEIERANRYQRKFCLLIIDLDKFKNFNDSYGHVKGNELLKTVSKVFCKTVRECDTVARFGGDEFLILLPETDLIEAKTVAQRLFAQTEKVLTERYSGAVSLSVGVAGYQGEQLPELLAKVDSLMYEVKKQGGSKICINRDKILVG